MAADKPTNYVELLQMLYDLLEPEEDKDDSMEGTKAYLKREGLNSEPIVRNIRTKISEMQGRQILAAAQVERKKLLNEFKSVCSELRHQRIEADSFKKAILSRVQELFGTGQGNVAFWRKFEESSEEDLISLLEDAELTRLLEGRDAGSRSETRS